MSFYGIQLYTLLCQCCISIILKNKILRKLLIMQYTQTVNIGDKLKTTIFTSSDSFFQMEQRTNRQKLWHFWSDIPFLYCRLWKVCHWIRFCLLSLIDSSMTTMIWLPYAAAWKMQFSIWDSLLATGVSHPFPSHRRRTVGRCYKLWWFVQQRWFEHLVRRGQDSQSFCRRLFVKFRRQCGRIIRLTYRIYG